MDIDLRPITPDEFEAWSRAISRGFGEHTDEEEIALRRPTVEFDRSIGALDGGEFVGGTVSYTWEMTVPGACLPVAVVDAVAVQPTHRRRGILTRMLRRQLGDIHDRGEPLAALLAAESIIYGRFGFGIGSYAERWAIATEHTAYARPHQQRGRIRFVDRDEARRVFPEVYERVRVNRLGMTGFQDYWWDFYLTDLERYRGGASADFHVVYEKDGKALGYATYRTKEGALTVRSLVAETDEAYASLWRYCLDVDLMSSTKAFDRATDEPLPWMLANPRKLERRLVDNAWLRLVDMRAALSGRRYARDGRLVIEVKDSFCPWNEGRLELDGGPDGAECRPTTAGPDLTLSAADLAAAYLGCVRPSTLTHSGRVEEHAPGALRLADAMFMTDRQPWTPVL